MQPQKVDSIHNYLTSDKILHTLMTSSNKKIQFNRSLTQQIHNAEAYEPNPSFIATTPRKERQSYKKKRNFQTNAQFILDSQQGKSQKFYKIDQNVDIAKTSNNQNRNNLHISQASSGNNKFESLQTPKSELVVNKNKQPTIYHDHSLSNRKFNVPNKSNPDVSRLAIQETINKLIITRNTLSEQILELKKLLDDVSVSLQNMDIQYQKIKQKILSFTSKALDAAFRQYKNNLPNWTKYENIQQRGLTKISEIEKAIQICQSQQKLKLYGGKQAIQKNISDFTLVIKQVKQATNQCREQRPIISQEKIKKLENVLRQFGEF